MKKTLRRLLSFLISLNVLFACGSPVAQGDQVKAAFEKHLSAVQVSGTGVVEKVLADDTQDSRHQRFIVRLGSGQTVLIDHNIDVAPRVNDLSVGDPIEFSGEYVWNEQGGLVHWTHRDPAGRHPSGWIKYRDQRYE